MSEFPKVNLREDLWEYYGKYKPDDNFIKPIYPICQVKSGNEREGMIVYTSEKELGFNTDTSRPPRQGCFVEAKYYAMPDFEVLVKKNLVKFFQVNNRGEVVPKYNPSEQNMLDVSPYMYIGEYVVPADASDMWSALPSVSLADLSSFLMNIIPYFCFESMGRVYATCLVLSCGRNMDSSPNFACLRQMHSNFFCSCVSGYSEFLSMSGSTDQFMISEGTNFSFVTTTLTSWEVLCERLNLYAIKRYTDCGLGSEKNLFPCLVTLNALNREGNIKVRSNQLKVDVRDLFRTTELLFNKYERGGRKAEEIYRNALCAWQGNKWALSQLGVALGLGPNYFVQ